MTGLRITCIVMLSASCNDELNHCPGLQYELVPPRPVDMPLPDAALVIADLDRDGHRDLVGGKIQTIEVLRGAGDGTFGAATVYESGATAPTAISAVDLNRDGELDLAVSTTEHGPTGQPPSLAVDIFLGTGDGRFGPKVVYSRAAFQSVADINRDGNLDLVLLARGVGVMYGMGDGTFSEFQMLTSVDWGAGGAVADLDGDGDLDFVIANGNAMRTVSVVLTTSGGYATPVAYPTGGNPGSARARDVNGDDRPDIVVINWLENTIGILFGAGGGTFTAPTTFATGPEPRSVVVEDLDGDRKPDLVIDTRDGIELRIGNGDGSFGPPTVYEVFGDHPVAVGDLDGNDWPELAHAYEVLRARCPTK